MSLQENSIKSLVELLQQANKRIEALEQDCDKWHKSYWDINDEHTKLRCRFACQVCQERRRNTHKGKTYSLCEDCADSIHDWKKTVEDLRMQLDYWQDCYETLLEEYLREKTPGSPMRLTHSCFRESITSATIPGNR